MISITMLEKFGRQTFISSVEVCNMIADSSKPNELRNVYVLRRVGIGTIPELHLRKVGILTLSDKVNTLSQNSYFAEAHNKFLLYPDSYFAHGQFRTRTVQSRNRDKVRIYYVPQQSRNFGTK